MEKVIGFDWYKTITEHPVMFTKLAKVFIQMGCRIIIISAFSDSQDENKYFDKVYLDIQKIGFPCKKIICVPFSHAMQIPQLKLEAAQKEGVTVFFDDRRDVCDLLNSYGIEAIRTPSKIT